MDSRVLVKRYDKKKTVIDSGVEIFNPMSVFSCRKNGMEEGRILHFLP